jgi:putative transcriptional regulator
MMSTTEFLTGKLLVAQPLNQDGHFAKSTVLVAQHSLSGAWGVVVNRAAKTVNMQAIMHAAGIESSSNETIYVGGPVEPTRVHVIHSLDWSSSSTLRITDDIGITGDVSVLAAISAGVGPTLYRAGVGLAVWSAGQLEGEQSGLEPWTAKHQWLTTDASIELCLTGAGEEQWQRAINDCVNQRIATLF